MPRGTVVTDTFARTVATGWGNADTGQAWSTISAGAPVTATDWSVDGTGGHHSVPTTVAYRASYLAGFSSAFVDLAVTGSVPVTAAGGAIELANLMFRGTGINTYYLARVQIETSQALTALILAPGGAQLGTVTVPGITYTAGLQIRVRVQAVGRVLRVKVWKASSTEPAAWVLTVADSTYTGAGFIGVRSGIAGGNSNTKPVVFTYTNVTSSLLPDFPNDQLPLTVLAAFGADLAADPSTWPWTNITSDVRASTVNITRGRGDETSQASPAACSFQLLNTSAAYSTGNPNGPNYPYVRRNTPIWVITDPATRFFGYAHGFVPSWDTTGKQAIVSVTASGVLRRLTQGKSPLQSPLRRAITARSELRAYWPMEDSSGATAAASAMPGGVAMAVSGLTFANDATEPGSAALPQFSAGATLTGQVSGTFASHWQVDWYYKIPADPSPSEPRLLSIYTTDVATVSGLRWDISVGGSTTCMRARATNTAGTIVIDSGLINIGPAYTGQWVHARLMVQQSGGNIQWQVVIFPLNAAGNFFNGTASGTVGAPYLVYTPPDAALAGLIMGHLAVFDAYNLGAADAAQTGFAGETATTRLARLCAEEGVPITITGTSTALMGPQSTETFVNLLRECEAADLGLLYDGYGPGLGYIARAVRENQAAAITLDVAAGEVDDPFSPMDDDQRNRNVVTVSRKNGSSATYTDKTGPLGTAAIGVYDSQTTLNLATDGVLLDYASWLVHLGTVEGLRYPALNLDLAAAPARIDDWVAAPLNSRIDVTNASSKATGLAPGTVSLLDEGYTETLGPYSWRVAATCSPFTPWRVFLIAAESGDTGEFVGRLDTDGSNLAAGITSSATSISVTTPSPNRPWTTASDDLPFDVTVDGERMTVTAVSGTASPQTFTVTRSVNGVVKPHSAGAAVSLWQPLVLGL